VVEYVRVAVELAAEMKPVRSILLVSDDLDWCRLKLGRLSEVAPLRFPPAGASVIEQLALLATARRLVLANSTFSYWGGYLSNRVQVGHGGGPNYADVIAPRFHNRQVRGGAAWQHDPRWSVVEDIPGGWDA
jgi:hypothetical protein